MKFPLLLLVVIASSPVDAKPTDTPDPAKLAAVIDARLAVEWEKVGVRPAPVVDDATFLRRASLDLIGRIPTVAEAREFFADKSSDKRAKLVNRLIDSGGHTRHMATVWRREWLPQADTVEFARLSDDFERWVTVRLQADTPYDRIVRELLTTPVALGIPAAVTRREVVTPIGFFTASENKPENLAANVTRAFLGVNLDCAQCHNHPIARWTRDQFWQTAAFFAPPVSVTGGKLVPAELTVPNTKKSLPPKFMDGSPLIWPDSLTAETGRRLFATWVTANNNPYFARNSVNRLWAQVYGTALVEPLDDLSGESSDAGANAELLKELAEKFVASGYDLKYMTRAFVLTKAYQFAAVVRGEKPSDPRLFARMPVRGLSGEQLYDSLRTAAGLPHERDDTGRGQELDARKRFAAQFHVERTVTAERSITQALSLMNGRGTSDLTDSAKNPTLAGVIDAPFLNTQGKVETLFLAVLGRTPTTKQSAIMVEYIESGGPENDPRRAVGDVFWALVNSTEFNTNH